MNSNDKLQQKEDNNNDRLPDQEHGNMSNGILGGSMQPLEERQQETESEVTPDKHEDKSGS